METNADEPSASGECRVKLSRLQISKIKILISPTDSSFSTLTLTTKSYYELSKLHLPLHIKDIEDRSDDAASP